MDMLQVGCGMSYDEDNTHFSMWCMLNSPLLAGNDLRKKSEQTIAILTNKETIPLNVRPAGRSRQADRSGRNKLTNLQLFTLHSPQTINPRQKKPPKTKHHTNPSFSSQTTKPTTPLHQQSPQTKLPTAPTKKQKKTLDHRQSPHWPQRAANPHPSFAALHQQATKHTDIKTKQK